MMLYTALPFCASLAGAVAVQKRELTSPLQSIRHDDLNLRSAISYLTQKAKPGMNHFPEAWGRPRDDIYGPYDHSHFQTKLPQTHTQQPIVTGTSVLGIKYSTGVVLAADNLASFGSMARFPDIRRILKFNDRVILGVGGDVSDMQYIDRMLSSLSTDQAYTDASPETSLSADNLHSYLQKVMYARRSDMNPLWNNILIAGLDQASAPFLAQVDLYGVAFGAPTLATGFGAHLALPILRTVVPDEEAWKTLDRESAVRALKECMKVLWYRDARSTN